MKKYANEFILIVLVLALCACGQSGTVAPTAVPTLSNDQMGTRAAQTAYANFTPVATIMPTDTPVAFTPTPSNTYTPLPPTATQGPTAPPTDEIFSTGQTTIRDDFESETGWYTGSSDNFIVEFSEGGYHIVVNMVTGSDPVYSIRQTNLSDILVSVDVMRYDGEDGSYFGVVCRYVDPSNYYRFVVYTEGEYEIAKKIDGVFTSLVREEDDSPLLDSNSTNNLRAFCLGDTLKLYVNDKLAVDYVDRDLVSGYVGILAGTDIEPGLDVLFDNFIVSQP